MSVRHIRIIIYSPRNQFNMQLQLICNINTILFIVFGCIGELCFLLTIKEVSQFKEVGKTQRFLRSEVPFLLGLKVFDEG